VCDFWYIRLSHAESRTYEEEERGSSIATRLYCRSHVSQLSMPRWGVKKTYWNRVKAIPHSSPLPPAAPTPNSKAKAPNQSHLQTPPARQAARPPPPRPSTALSRSPCIRPRTAPSSAVAPSSRRRAVFGGHLLGGEIPKP
jgi:hypothetical protein